MIDHITKLALWWLRRAARDSNIVAHGLKEMALSGMREDDPEDGPNKWIARATHNLLAVFSQEGHSGSSASYAVALFKTLAQFKPWGPLTGADSEWNEVSDGILQNNRCGSVFKTAEGAYNIDGIVGKYPDGSCVTSGRLGRDYITFPYTPTTRYVDLDSEGEMIEPAP